MLVAARVLLASEAIPSSLYRQAWQMGKWNLGVSGKFLSIAMLSCHKVAQLRVSGAHKGSGYPRIAFLSCESQLSARDLPWLLGGNSFPASRRGLFANSGLFVAGRFSEELSHEWTNSGILIAFPRTEIWVSSAVVTTDSPVLMRGPEGRSPDWEEAEVTVSHLSIHQAVTE